MGTGKQNLKKFVQKDFMKIEPKRFTALFPLVFSSFGSTMFIVGIAIVFLALIMVILGEDDGSFLISRAGFAILGFFLVFSAYKAVGSIIPPVILSFGCCFAITGIVVLVISSITKDIPATVSHISIVCVGIGILLEYFSYRKLVEKLGESENKIIRYDE